MAEATSEYVRLRRRMRLKKYLYSVVAATVVAVLLISVAVGVVESDGAFEANALFGSGVAALSERFLGTRIGVGTVDFLTLLVVLAWCARQLQVMWRAERSPEIEVSANGGEGVTAGQATALADRLRRYLSEVSVGPPPAVPGTGSATELVEAVRTAREQRSEFAANVAALLLSATSPVGYRLHAVFSAIDDTKSITAHFDALVHRRSEIHEYRGTTWEEAIERAAHGTAALVIPLTSGARSDRWIVNSVRSSDHGRFLLHQYLSAQRLEQSRRLDEAMQSYNNVLRGVPQDWSRIALGNLHSELGNFLDALGNYLSASESSERNPIARYRLAVTLGYVEYLIKSWKPSLVAHAGEERQKEIGHLRDTLAPRLQARYGERLRPSYDDGHWQRFAKGEGDILQHMFLAMSRSEFAWLADDLRERRYRREWLGQSSADPDWAEITSADVDLAQHSSRVREASVLHGQGETAAYHELFPHRDVAGTITKIVGTTRLRNWQNHYNVACAFAVAMKANAHRESTAAVCCESADTLRHLAERAVWHLDRAVELSGGSIIRTKRRWILRDDPDLAELRDTQEFKSFRTRVFPSLSYKDPEWEEDPLKRAARYTLGLIVRAAMGQSRTWRQRIADIKGSYRQSVLADWAREDARSWEHVADVARNFDHWQTRLEFTEAFWPQRTGYRDDPGLTSVATRYDRAIIQHYGLVRRPTGEDWDVEQRVFAVQFSDQVEVGTLPEVREITAQLAARSHEWESYFGGRIAGGVGALDARIVRELAGRAANNWVTLSRLFVGGDIGTGMEQMHRALEATQDPPRDVTAPPRLERRRRRRRTS